MKETIEHNNRFYGEELKTESEQLKEWLVVANKEIERLNEELGDANYTITQLHKVMDRHYVKKEDYDRLNNIINELEKELNKDFNTYMIRNRQYGKVYKAGADNYRMHIYLKLQKLKGSDKE